MDVASQTFAFASLAVTVVTVIITTIYRQHEINERKNAEQRNSIEKNLNEFYGPLVSNLNVVKALYKLFSRNKPDTFRTLLYLLNPNQEYQTVNGKEKVILSDTDKKLLEEIIEIERKIEELIISKSGLVDDEKLMFNYVPNAEITDVRLDKTSLIAMAIAHFRILRMAYDGHFTGEVERFKNFVYPREFDNAIKDKMDKMREDLSKLY